MIRYVQGDLLNSNLKVIAHGCNCQGVMGSGIAAQIRAKWPNVYEVYKLKHTTMGLELGTILPVCTLDGRLVINCMTQDNFGRSGDRFVSYEAVESCMTLLNENAPGWGVAEIGMPKIGAGLGGGDWEVIEDIIIRNSKTFIPVVYTL